MRKLVEYRWYALFGLALALACLAPGLPTATNPNNSLSVWFLDDDPKVEAYRTFQRTFGNDEVILVHVPEGDGEFGEAARQLREIEGVERVESVGADPEVETTSLRNGEGAGAMLAVRMAKMENFDKERDRIVGEVRQVVDDVYREEARMGGVGVIYSALNELTQRDFGLFLVVGYLLMFLAMWWLFRSKYLVVAAIGVVGGATTFALAALGSAGHRLNMITVLLPTLIIVLGIADAVHFPVAFRRSLDEASPDATRLDIVAEALRKAARPCLMTSLTTMASFAALASSRMSGLRQLGIYAAVGIGAAFVVSLVAMAIALMRVDLDDDPSPQQIPLVDTFLEHVRHLLADARPLVVAATLVVGSLGVWGFTQLDVDTYTLGYLPDDHEVVRDHEAIEESWGPYVPLEYTVEPTGERRYESADLLERTREFAERAEDHPRIGDSVHLEEIYRRTAGSITADKVRSVRSRLPREVHERFVDREEGVGRITLTAEMMSAAELRSTIDELDTIADDVFGGRAEVRAAGYLPVYATVVDYIVDSQIRSFLIALALIFGLMLVWMRSVRLALISLVPNLFPVLVMLGTMGAAGIALDAATAVLAALVLGIAIDDTIHFLHHWREAEEEGLSWRESLERTLRRAGPAICTTSLLLLIGFPVLMLASIKTVVYFGLLTTVAAVAAIIGDLFVLPLLLRLFPPDFTSFSNKNHGEINRRSD